QTRPERDPNMGLALDKLAAESAGLLCLTGGARGLAYRLAGGQRLAEGLQWFGQLQENFADRLYLELAPGWPLHGRDSAQINRHLAGLAEQARVPLVVAGDVHTLRSQDAELQKTLAAMRLVKPLAELPAEAAAPPGAHFLTQSQMRVQWADFAEAV